MSMPKKIKYSIKPDPLKIGTEYLKYGFDRIEELMNATNENTVYLPRSVEPEDLDQSIFDLINDDKLKLIIDGKKVPVFYLDNERWGEFEKTWKFVDNDKNVPTPYITIRRIGKAPGTRLGEMGLVPFQKKFKFIDVPILDNNEVVFLRFKGPQPTNIDFTYEVSLFTKYRVDVNEYDKIMFELFSSKIEYVFVKNNPLPISLETTEEANSIENIDGDRFLVARYNILLKGIIQDESKFSITKTYRKTQIGISLYP